LLYGYKANGILNTYPLRCGTVHSNNLESQVYSSGSIREVIYSVLLSPDEVRAVMLFPVLDATLKGTGKLTGCSPENSKNGVMFKKQDL